MSSQSYDVYCIYDSRNGRTNDGEEGKMATKKYAYFWDKYQ